MKKYNHFGFILYLNLIFIISACNHHSTINHKNDLMQDSLSNLCERLAMELQTDSLRQAANNYLRITTPHSRDYYKALQFQLLADFNARDYDKTLATIKQVASLPNFYDYADLACHYQYTRARSLQYSGQFDEAIKAFKDCFTYDSDDDTIRESIRSINLNALQQLMNTFLNSGKLQECVDYFRHLGKQPTPLMQDYCLRDINSLLAYALYCNDSDEEAERTIERSLVMPLINPTPERLFRDYSYAAAICFGNANMQEQVIEWCNEAIKNAEDYKYTIGIQWTKALLGKIYYKMGRIDDAVDLYTKSANSARQTGDLKGEANAYNSMANLYLYWEQFDQANEYATIALNNNLAQQNINPMLCGEAFLMKGMVMSKMAYPDSAIYYWGKADSCFADISYSTGAIGVDKQLGTFLIDNGSEEALSEGIKRLTRVLQSTAWYDRAPSYFQLAKGFIKQNKINEGEAMLDSMYSILNSSSSPFYLEDANRFALQHYLDKNDAQRIQQYANAYLQETSKKFEDHIAKKVTEAMIQYQTERKEQLLLLAQAQLIQKELNIRFYVSLLIILLILLMTALLWFAHKQRFYSIKHQLVEERCKLLIKDIQSTRRHSAEVETQLNELLSDKDSRMEIVSVTPKLYRKSGEGKFMDQFAQLYPTFLLKLREKVPSITNNEEVLCMLIILEQTTDQMVDILCIARSSINMARHRLRKKMDLNKEDSLEEIIKSLVQ